MSPIQAMERSYVSLKQMLRDGMFPPGTRLEANRLADELGVSMTPVRDVLHRLTGERLVVASRDGFHAPRFSEGALRDLYEWNAALLTLAVRTHRGSDDAAIPARLEIPAGPERIATLFARIGSGAPNREIAEAIGNASDRLHPFRIVEQNMIAPVEGELDEMVVRGPSQAQAIRRYHLRRMRAVPDLLRARGEA